MPAVHRADDRAVGGVERREQAGGAVPDVVVGPFLRHARHHRERRLRPGQGLHLGLLVHAEHHRGLGRVQIQPDDVEDLVHEQRVGGQLERLAAMRLELERPPDPPDARLRQPGPLGHLRPRPVRGMLRGRLQRRDHHVLDLLGSDRGRPSRPLVIGQAVQPQLHEPRPPLTHRRRRDALPSGDLLVVQARPHSRARSASATPTPAPTCAAGPTAATDHAHPRTAPTRPSGVRIAAYPSLRLIQRISGA